MKFRYFKEDQTQYLREDIAKAVGRYQEILIFDSEKQFHCCELTPSYECHPVTFVTDNEITDEMYEELQSCFDSSPRYYHCHVADKVAKDCPPPPDRWEDDTDEEYLEDCLEYYQCNSGALEYYQCNSGALA